MNVLAGRLVVAVLLFGGWISYLGYLVATRPKMPDGRPLILSRSQVLVSDLDVVAEVADPKADVTIQQVLYPQGDAEAEKLPGQKVRVTNLAECRPIPRSQDSSVPGDWTGPGSYLLPLRRSPTGQDAYEVVPTPATVGYPPPGAGVVGPPRIYPATEQALAQYREIPKVR